MLGGIISGGLSLVSGLFGKSSAEKKAKAETKAIATANEIARKRADAAALVPEVHTTVTGPSSVTQTPSWSSGSIDLKQMVADAEAAGFNPLTVLRAGGMGGYQSTYQSGSTQTSSGGTSTETITGGHAMDAALAGNLVQSSSTPVPSYGDVFANALQAGGNAYMANVNTAQAQQFQKDLVAQQLKGASGVGAYGQTSAPNGRSFYVPSSATAGTTSASTGGSLNAGLGGIFKTANTSDDSEWQKRYGMIGDVLGGVINMTNDVYKNMETNPYEGATNVLSGVDAIGRSAGAWFKRVGNSFWNTAAAQDIANQRNLATQAANLAVGGSIIGGMYRPPVGGGGGW